MLDDGQVKVRDLLMGPGTPYRVLGEFNPFQVRSRAETSDRSWGHGGWSGAEWATVRAVPMRIIPVGEDAGSWLTLHQQLAAAFAPVGASGVEAELRWALGGTEYLLFGRPRLVDPDVRLIGSGKSVARCQFVALDPFIYQADEQLVTVGLPEFEGGLTVPFTVPFSIDAVAVDGFADLENTGTAPTGMLWRIDGPVSGPRVTVQGPDGQVDSLRFMLDLAAGQWLEVDVKARTVLLNGQASRRGQTAGTWPALQPGTSTVLFRADDDAPDAELSVWWRSAWW